MPRSNGAGGSPTKAPRTASPRRFALALAGIVLVALGVTSCSDDPDLDPGSAPAGGRGPAATATPFGSALARVGSGTIPIGTGYGWIDVRRLRADGHRFEPALDWAARALGPGGAELVLERDQIKRRTGINLGSSAGLLSSAASYTLGVRLDGVDPSRLRHRLLRYTRVRARRGSWQLFNLGRVSSIPFGTPAEAFGPFGPRLALGAHSLVAARREQSRRDLTGAAHSPLDDPAAALSVACLGNVVAARIVPNNFTHWPNSGPELLAFGVEMPAAGAPREVLCAADPDLEQADDVAAAMSAAFADDAVDAVTGEPVSDLIASAEVEVIDGAGAAAARAELELAPGREPGFLFGAFVRGSLVTYVGLRPPEPVDAGD